MIYYWIIIIYYWIIIIIRININPININPSCPVRIGCERTEFLLAPYWQKSNCSTLKIFRIKLTVSIYGGKVTSNSIERLRPVTYNTTLSISFPQNVTLDCDHIHAASKLLWLAKPVRRERARKRQSPSHSHLRASLARFLETPPNREPA